MRLLCGNHISWYHQINQPIKSKSKVAKGRLRFFSKKYPWYNWSFDNQQFFKMVKTMPTMLWSWPPNKAFYSLASLFSSMPSKYANLLSILLLRKITKNWKLKNKQILSDFTFSSRQEFMMFFETFLEATLKIAKNSGFLLSEKLIAISGSTLRFFPIFLGTFI